MIDDEELDKDLGQFRLQLNGILGVYALYGMDVYTPQVKEEIVKVAVQLHHRLSGLDVPIGKDFDYGGPDD